jgi:hypothetical protein
MARVSTDPDAAAQCVKGLGPALASAVLNAKSPAYTLGRNADSRQASGHHVAQSGTQPLFERADTTSNVIGSKRL